MYERAEIYRAQINVYGRIHGTSPGSLISAAGREGQEMPSQVSHDPSPQQGTAEGLALEDDGFGKAEVCVCKQKWGRGDRMLTARWAGLFSLGDIVHLTVLL